LRFAATRLTFRQINEQIGLDNIETIDSHWSFLSKSDLPTKRYLEMSDELVKAPVGISAAQRAMYYCGKLVLLDIQGKV
jgi:hypothetical protein